MGSHNRKQQVIFYEGGEVFFLDLGLAKKMWDFSKKLLGFGIYQSIWDIWDVGLAKMVWDVGLAKNKFGIFNFQCGIFGISSFDILGLGSRPPPSPPS